MTLLHPQGAGVPQPQPTHESAIYWDGVAAGELRYQRCDSCGAANFGPGVACRSCQTRALTWEVSAGNGVLYAWTVVWRAPLPVFDVPYAPAIVRLDEGYDMMSAIVGIDHEAIEAGLALEVEFHHGLPYFAPVR